MKPRVYKRVVPEHRVGRIGGTYDAAVKTEKNYIARKTHKFQRKLTGKFQKVQVNREKRGGSDRTHRIVADRIMQTNENSSNYKT